MENIRRIMEQDNSKVVFKLTCKVRKQDIRQPTVNSCPQNPDQDNSSPKSEVTDDETELFLQNPVHKMRKKAPVKHAPFIVSVDDKGNERFHVNCNVCGSQFGAKDAKALTTSLTGHMKFVHNKDTLKRHPCPHCDFTTVRRKGLEYHINAFHTEKTIKCDQCPKLFAHGRDLRRHTRLVHIDASNYIDCPYCDVKQKSSSALVSHIKCMHEEGPKEVEIFTCDFCDNSYSQSNSLKEHILAKHHDSTVTCDTCGKEFESELQCKKHKSQVHNMETKECRICQKLIKSYNFRRHIRTHEESTQFECDICQKQFRRSANLKRHVESVHQKIKNFFCGSCPFSTYENSSLMSHIKTHHK